MMPGQTDDGYVDMDPHSVDVHDGNCPHCSNASFFKKLFFLSGWFDTQRLISISQISTMVKCHHQAHVL